MKLEVFIREHVKSSVSSVRFTRKSIERRVYQRPARVIRSAETMDEMLAIFDADEDVQALRDVLSMPHVAAVEFFRDNDEKFGVNASILRTPGERFSSYFIDSETSQHHPTALLHALRRRVALDAVPVAAWREEMRRRGYDVRLTCSDDAFVVRVHTIDDGYEPDAYPLHAETRGRTPYEALAEWRIYVSDKAVSAFQEIAQ